MNRLEREILKNPLFVKKLVNSNHKWLEEKISNVWRDADIESFKSFKKTTLLLFSNDFKEICKSIIKGVII